MKYSHYLPTKIWPFFPWDDRSFDGRNRCLDLFHSPVAPGSGERKIEVFSHTEKPLLPPRIREIQGEKDLRASTVSYRAFGEP